jgi:TnpA family transposase
LTRPINWKLIRQQYNELVKFASAIYFRTAEADSILKRFTRANVQHPTYQALVELGRAIKTIFLCRYLRDEALRREILEALNIVENWHSANRFVFFGNNGELTYSDRIGQETSIQALHLLQNSLIYINTLMLQQVLAAPRWFERMTEADWRGLTPLFYEHVTPYGSFNLDLKTRLPLKAV